MSAEPAIPSPDTATVEADIAVAMASLRDRHVKGVWEDRVITALVRIGEPAIPVVIDALHGRNRLVAARAARVLGQSHLPGAREALRTYVRDTFGRLGERKWRRRFLSAGRFIRPGLFLLYVILDLRHQSHLSSVALSWWGILHLTEFQDDPAAGVRQAAVSALADAHDLQDIDLLARCLDDEVHAIRREAATGLKQILHRLRASDAGLLSDEAMAALIRQLGRRDTGMILAILGALEQVGDERALPAVARLAAGHGAGRDAKVCQAAEECLPALHERADRSQSAHGLLRPAEASEEQSSALLRPASGTETASEALVRPAGGMTR